MTDSSPKVVILCGGKGTRLHEETEFRPKPMVPIGGIPILVHIMNIYSYYGFNDFVLCLGYKGDMIEKFFTSENTVLKPKDTLPMDKWHIDFAHTGLETQTGARIKRAQKYVDSDNFLATYGDGLSDINIKKLLDFHKKQNTVGTISAVHPHSKYGLIKEGKNGVIDEFVEKPVLYEYINGGFFAFKNEMFDYISDDEGCILEHEPFTNLVAKKQLSMLKHEGFWHCMDTYKDYLELNEMWDSGNVPWKKLQR